MQNQLTWTALVFFLAVFDPGESRRCFLNFRLTYDGDYHDWQFYDHDVDHVTCKAIREYCDDHAEGWARDWLNYPPTYSGEAARTLCEHYNMEIPANREAIVGLWWTSSSCGESSVKQIGNLCCDRDANGYVIPNNGCKQKLDGLNSTMTSSQQIGNLCCDRDANGYVIPNNGCKQKLDGLNSTMTSSQE